MKQFLRIHLPATFAASLFAVACGGPMEEASDVAETQALQEREQALATLTTGIALCTNMGNGFFGCSGGANGGTPPYSYSWTGNQYVSITHVATGPSNTRIDGTCTIGRLNQVTLTVTDSVGATASATRNVGCSLIVP